MRLGFCVALAICVLILTPLSIKAAELPASFADLAEKLIPAVVNISTTQHVEMEKLGGEQFQQLPPGHPFENFNEFFEEFLKPQMEEEDITSLGSGFVIDADGYIVTNNHVIADAEEITVSFVDDSQYKAKVIGRDPKTDLAVLKIDAGKKLPFVTLGDSDKIRVGDWIVAIGNPFGLGGTVTAGIISARARDINAGPFDDFLQTDAAINRGNSGGPMFNLSGEVIGVNTAIYSPSGGSVGIGFAVPMAVARPVIEQLKAGIEIKRGWLGVKIQQITPEIAESLGIKEEKGALVAEVTPGSPAEKAGIKNGDVILTFDGKEITTMRKLPRYVAETEVGKKAKLEVLRQGTKINVSVEIGKMTDEAEKKTRSPNAPEDKAEANEIYLGMEVSALDDKLRESFRLNEKARGLVILRVESGSQAARKGLRAGDVLEQAQQQELTSPEDLKEALKAASNAKRKSVLLRVNRGGDSLFIAVPLEK